MKSTTVCDSSIMRSYKEVRSRSVQGLANVVSSPVMKIPLPPRLWITDVEDESSDEDNASIDGVTVVERSRVRSRFRHHKQRSTLTVPIGIFWDIENCQVPRGCSAIDVVAAIRAKFLVGRREADFVVVCDVRKESSYRLQELNDAQVSLIHVCGTQKNAADEKLRQCMRRFGELHSAPASMLLISGDINFAADLCDFRHRKNMEVILVHKQNTSSALIACASSHHCYNELTAHLPRNPKVSQTEEDEEPTCEIEVTNLPMDQPPERVSRRLRRLADNCGGKVLRVTAPTAILRFPTPDHASRALKRMDGEDVFGRKISTRYARSALQPVYSSDEGYSTGPPQVTERLPLATAPRAERQVEPNMEAAHTHIANQWALALKQLPAPTPPPLDFCPPPAPKPRKIRGTHGSANLDRSGSSNSDDSRIRDTSQSRAMSPWNSSSFSEQSDGDIEHPVELTVSNLPPQDPALLQEMLIKLFSEYVPVVRVSVWTAIEGPLATVVLRSEWDARLVISRIHKRQLKNQWAGRRLELSIEKANPAPNLNVLRARIRRILLEQQNFTLPLLRLRDAYASRHSCALTTNDIAKLKDIVILHEGCGRMVQLIDLSPVTNCEIEETPWKCHLHAMINAGHEDGTRILQPVYVEMSMLAHNTQLLLDRHGGVLPLLSFVECYEAMFPPLVPDIHRGVPLELLLRNVPSFEVKDTPTRHLTWRTRGADSPPSCNQSESSRSSDLRDKPRTAPALEPMLSLFERELVDLLRTQPRCSLPFSKLIPSFHHHFGRQCRVADYGFTKLPDLLATLTNTIVVLGAGSYRIITLSAAAQSRRWTSDLVKLLKAQSGRAISPQDLPRLYQATFGRLFSPVDYGVCTLNELMQRVNAHSVIVADGTIALPRRAPTPEERARTADFAVQAIELLRYTPNLRMEFSRFVPAYHAHFGRQLRVAHYGCVKLVELFDLIPEVVIVWSEANGERTVRLAALAARDIITHRLKTLAPVALSALPAYYSSQYGAPPLPDVLEVNTLEEMVVAAGGYVDNGIVHMSGNVPNWATGVLLASSVLSSDPSVARGSTQEYFMRAFRRMLGEDPDLHALAAAGVIIIDESDRRVRLTSSWRTVWRLAQILEQSAPLTPVEVYKEYTKQYEPYFPSGDMGIDSVVEFMKKYATIFSEIVNNGGTCWTLSPGVSMPPRQRKPLNEDYSLYDTPPGQKGSRVFESPRNNIWSSPPASALPTPTALLTQERRRTRLAAQFDAA